MPNKKLFIISFFCIIIVAIFHFFSLENSWYWTYKWIDIPVHIFAGLGIALMALWISLKVKHIDNILGYKRKALLIILLTVLLFAVCWEIYELIFKATSINYIGYWRDSISDVCGSLVGGIIAFMYFTKRKRANRSLSELKHLNNFVVNLSNN